MSPLHTKPESSGVIRSFFALFKKSVFGEGVLLIRPSPCPLPARGEGVLMCGGCAPTPPVHFFGTEISFR